MSQSLLSWRRGGGDTYLVSSDHKLVLLGVVCHGSTIHLTADIVKHKLEKQLYNPIWKNVLDVVIIIKEYVSALYVGMSRAYHKKKVTSSPGPPFFGDMDYYMKRKCPQNSTLFQGC